MSSLYYAWICRLIKNVFLSLYKYVQLWKTLVVHQASLCLQVVTLISSDSDSAGQETSFMPDSATLPDNSVTMSSIKASAPYTFWPSNPAAWFSQAESTFRPGHISNSWKKYDYVVMKLPESVLTTINDTHWSSGSAVCFPPRGAVVQITRMHPHCWNWDFPVSNVSLQSETKQFCWKRSYTVRFYQILCCSIIDVWQIFYGHIHDFWTPSRPLHGHSRPPIFHGHQFFSTATFLENGRHHGYLAPVWSSWTPVVT
jgi:hypothetical protein